MNRGLTLVELLVVLVILILVLGVVYTTFSVHQRGKIRESTLLQAQEIGELTINILARDIMMAGYGVNKKLALYILDGGNGPDKLYINDWTFLDDNDLLNGVWGQARILSGSGSSVLKLTTLDIDSDGKNEFLGRVNQFLISDISNYQRKISKIVNVDATNNELILDRQIAGDYVAPTIYYEIDGSTLKKSARDTGGRQPIADNIVDLQISYRDIDGNWYCDDPDSNCPMDPFDPEKIVLVRINLVVKSKKRTYITNNPWPLENRVTGPYDPDYTYRVYTIEIAPRNLIYNR